jgi:hypothetical protein
MNADIRAHVDLHRLGESATRPIEPRYGALAALLLLAGMSPPGRYRPQADGLRQTTDSPQGLSVSGLSPKGEYRSAQQEGTPVSPQRRRALPTHRIAAHSGAFNCRF